MSNTTRNTSSATDATTQPLRTDEVKRQTVFHPNVLLVRWEMAARARSWLSATAVAKAIIAAFPSEPIGWIYHGFAEQQMGQVSEARQTLLVAARKFPNDWRIAYNLACYAAQLGDIGGAWNWLDRALEMGDASIIEACATQEPSLKTLWQKRSEPSPAASHIPDSRPEADVLAH